MDIEVVEALHARLTKIEEILVALVTEKNHQAFYSTTEVAEELGKAEFTVREWCRLGRVHAQKRLAGRGRSHEWMISHEELVRIRNEGLLPVPKPRLEY